MSYPREKKEGRRLEERAQELGATAEVLNVAGRDARQVWGVRRGEVRQRIALEIGPEDLDRIELGGVWRQQGEPELERIKLALPGTAIEAIVGYTTSPPGGKVRRYRTPDDREPIVLEGPGGERRVGLLEPQTLHFEFLDGAERFKLWTAGGRRTEASRNRNHFFLVRNNAPLRYAKSRDVETASADRVLPQHS